MDLLIDIIYHAAFLTTLVGTRLISGGKTKAWWLRVIADILFLVGGLLMGMSSFITWTIAMLYMDTSSAIRLNVSEDKEPTDLN